MDRDTATNKLEKKKVGTYLLRVRPQGASNSYETIYALSLKYTKLFLIKIDEFILFFSILPEPITKL